MQANTLDGRLTRDYRASLTGSGVNNWEELMAHIIVLGGGIGGVSVAYELKQAVRKEDRVTLVSNKPFFQFTPSNPWVAVKWRSKDDITIDIASVLPKHGVGFSAAGAKRVHADGKPHRARRRFELYGLRLSGRRYRTGACLRRD